MLPNPCRCLSGHSPPRIEVGDSMFVLAKSIRTIRPSEKLSKCYLGLFKVTGKPCTHLYQIKFPQHLQAIHSVFHISQLELANPSKIPNHINPPPLPIIVNGELEYEISQVLCYDLPWTGLLTSGDSGCHQWTAVGVRVTPLGRCNNNRTTWERSCQAHDMDT